LRVNRHQFKNRSFTLPSGISAFLKALIAPAIALRLVTALVILAGPQFAIAEPWDEGAEGIYDAIMSVARWASLIAIAVMGYMCLAGKLAWGTAGMIAGGIFILVGGEAIYTYFSDAIG